MRRTVTLRSYQRGNWCPGSKHQKHQSFNPTLFLYRFAGPHGPGPYTMKYWWTLGCFPTGLGVPFRLSEFLQTYCTEHVPAEVEEWLNCFVKHPAESLVPNLERLLEATESVAEVEECEGYTAVEPSIAALLAPLKALESSWMVTVSPSAVRAVMSDRRLRSRMVDELYDYKEAVKSVGSTPHRRAGLAMLEGSHYDVTTAPSDDGLKFLASVLKQLPPSNPHQATVGSIVANDALGRQTGSSSDALTPAARQAVGIATSSLPSSTADDEKRLIRLMTTFAEGSMKRRRYGDACNLLSSMLLFSHDDDVRGEVHSNLASAFNMDGRFKDAEFHGMEAAMLKASPRGYANWATSVAYQDDFEKATRIINDALAIHVGNDMLEHTRAAICAAATMSREVPIEMRGLRAHLPSQQRRGLEEGQGRGHDNEFDSVIFNQKQYAAKMDPRSIELGSVFRRTGDFGGHIASTKTMEPL